MKISCGVVVVVVLGFFQVHADPVLPVVRPAMAHGSLVVRSATMPGLQEAGAEFDWLNNRNIHTGYTVYRADGSVVRHVVNHFGPEDDQPANIDLPTGHFKVRALSARQGWVTVPVVIKSNQVTVVDLEH